MTSETLTPETSQVAAEMTAPALEVTSAQKPFEHTDVPSLLAIGDKDVPAAKPETAAPEVPVVAEVSAVTPEKVEGEVKPEVKPEETKEVKPEVKPEITPEEVKVETPPVEYKFTPPEGFTFDEAKIAPYVDILKENNISLEAGQKLFDLHAQAIQEINTNTLAEQHRAFADVRKEWQGKIMSDSELGGSGFKTVEGAVARMRDKFVPEKHFQEFNDFLNTTGAGEHPALWRLLWNVAKAFDEPAPTPAGGNPPPNHGKPPSRKGMKSLYTNPSSNS